MKKIFKLSLVCLLCISLCACSGDNEKEKEKTELTIDNWQDYISFAYSLDADEKEYDEYFGMNLYSDCNVDLELKSKSERLTFEDATITFKIETYYADYADNLSSHPNKGIIMSKDYETVTVDLDLFGNGYSKFQVSDWLCYLPQFPVKSFTIESISGYVIMD